MYLNRDVFMTKPVNGFSKFTKEEKINWLITNYLQDFPNASKILRQYWNDDKELQELHDEFIENTITNYYLPLGIAPNFLIDDTLYAIPMAIEESSVVAAASNAAKFWLKRGGFKAEVISTEKVGQVHFMYQGNKEKLKTFFKIHKKHFFDDTEALTKNMRKRGGGITHIELVDKTEALANYFQLHCTFETKDAMGANFINSCLEQFSKTLVENAQHYSDFSSKEKQIEVVMSILSNYVPNCLVRASVSCPVSELNFKDYKGKEFAEKFCQAVNIAQVEPYRAVTHNKGIMNGVDAVILATGNDFRAVEAGVHAYAAKDGQYRSLTDAEIDEDGIFHFWIDLPLALGTVGGLTSLHPLVKMAMHVLKNPSANELMKIVAVAGLAQNFAALKSLTTTGIQEGHMKMHLMNIMNQFDATSIEKDQLIQYFTKHNVSHNTVVEQLKQLRGE
ncbi:hydroxymethylglutaryl-CoA reductase, degradative [Gangjinia marincola]|uniref:3-hydroxy-3-methylglutaryl coenzyme A reductase n=2 Tax=Gangjinia marincola TaxID=578463 RepID=A0ABN1MHB2_9FLAO